MPYDMTRPLDISCPKHDTYMVPHVFEPLEDISLPQGVEVFRCPNLSCSIFMLRARWTVSTLKSNGELAPYLKSGQQ
jgi:hypothetical protein